MGSRAVVIGGSVAGLLAACALVGAFAEIIVLDADVLGEGPRRCVPQGRHVHALLPQGVRALESLLPGTSHALRARGAVGADLHRDAIWVLGGYALARARGDLEVVASSRVLLESEIRGRVRALGVGVREGARVEGLRVAGGRVGGVETSDGPIDADLVVDASGRGTRVPRWLAEAGFEVPEVEEIGVSLDYVSCDLAIPPALVPALAVIVASTPERPFGAVMQQVEGGRWLVSLSSYEGAVTPRTAAARLTHARALPVPWVALALEQGVEQSAWHAFHYAGARRRRWETVRPPEGIVAVGDAVCSFNPVYAQGMTTAALQALALRDALAAGGLSGLWGRVARACAPALDVPWQLGLTTDLAIAGRAQPRTARWIGAWIRTVQRAAAADPVVAGAFLRVASLVAPPPTLLRPALAWRVLARTARASARSASAPEHGEVRQRAG